jgi:hypothetical protein
MEADVLPRRHEPPHTHTHKGDSLSDTEANNGTDKDAHRATNEHSDRYSFGRADRQTLDSPHFCAVRHAFSRADQ